MSSTGRMKSILGPEGVLGRALQAFESRPSQIAMAERIWSLLRSGGVAVLEAGTGTGKTFGYLVPLLLSGKKCVVSTGTKNLQEQVFYKDLPILEKILGTRVEAVMMKGRTNYLCLYHFQRLFEQKSLFQNAEKDLRERLETWCGTTRFADRAELPWLGDNDPLWEALTCTSERCLGTACPVLDDCYYMRLRRAAARADLIIVNHHLFFADLKVRQGGFGEVLPRFQVAVFDEAHQLEEVATTYFGESLSSTQLRELLRDLEKEASSLAKRHTTALRSTLISLRALSDELVERLSSGPEKELLAKSQLQELAGAPGRQLARVLDEIKNWCGAHGERRPALQALELRAQEMGRILQQVMVYKGAEWIHWYERRKRRVALHVSPLDISGILRETIFQRLHATVLTSATLSTGGNFNYIRAHLGVPEDAAEHILPSHFDYHRQCLLYIPRDLPPPTAQGFGSAVAERLLSLLTLTRGRALVLFTSHSNLNLAYSLLQGQLRFPLLKQGEAPRTVLLERFREDVSSVLLATGSFWEGVDVPGEALSALIVDKLPFESPAEPLVAARIAAVRSRGGNPFLDHQLPAAIIALRQGLGRLIRSVTDRGILAILDVRLHSSSYGGLFLKSLPPMPVTEKLHDVADFFKHRGGAPA